MGVIFDLVAPTTVFCDSTGSLLSEWLLDTDIWSYDTYFFRGIGKKIFELKTFIDSLAVRGKDIVEPCLIGGGVFPEDKFVPKSKKGLYEFPETKNIIASTLLQTVKEIQFPVVVKKTGSSSSMGKGVALVDSINELEFFLSDFVGVVQVQQQHKFEYDTRVLVVGGKCLGGFDRYKKGNSFLTNRRGGRREVANLTSDQISAAIEATELQGLEIAGVDMFFDRGRLYIIEVNSSPQFTVFEKNTEINIARYIIEYLIRDK